MEYYSVIKNDKLFPFAVICMELENIMLREIIQTDQDLMLA